MVKFKSFLAWLYKWIWWALLIVGVSFAISLVAVYKFMEFLIKAFAGIN